MSFDPRDSPSIFAEVFLGMRLYPWQVEALEHISMSDRVSLRAANGSGKTASVIAVAILWFLWRHPRGRCAVISGSWMQVKHQLFPAMERYKSHELFRVWQWNQCNIITPQGGEVIGFSTNNAGRAEGWHSSPDAPVFYIVDEAKTVPDSIFTAIDRCTLTYSLYASSPGTPSGQFYRSHYSEAHLFYPIKATAYDCPHISKERIAHVEAKYEPDHPVRRSMLDAEFTDLDHSACITSDELRNAVAHHKIPDRVNKVPYAFCDFAAGRDENVLAKCHLGIAEIVDAWRDRNTIQAARRFARTLQSHDIQAYNAHGDADGLGIGMIQQMHECKYRINEFRGGTPSDEPEHYNNLITQIWYEGARKIAKGEVIIKDCDALLFDQLTTRKLEYDSKNRLKLISKEDMRADGIKSPDRADALLGAIWAAATPKGVFTDDTPIIEQIKNPFEAPAWDFGIV